MAKGIGKKLFTIICIVLAIITIANAILPICSYAAKDDNDEDSIFGGKIFKPICKLVCAISDAVMAGLQKMFIGYGEIASGIEGLKGVEVKNYNFLYGPGVIFSNKVPALNANFINPNEDPYQITVDEALIKVKKIKTVQGKLKSKPISDDDVENQLTFDEYESKAMNKLKASSKYGWSEGIGTQDSTNSENAKVEHWKNEADGKTYYLERIKVELMESHYIRYYLFVAEETKSVQGESINYSSKTLRSVLSKWYNGLRTLALVGLLSVLVYVGIRIIIATNGKEREKYKKMIGDWLAAICILFILHYLMAFITNTTSELLNLFPEAVGETGSDSIMSDLRNTIATKNDMFFEIFAETVMYVTLVVLTCVFTFHYLKRFIYLAFLTMIAPLIALTYPLDKIKDGQAQAFTLWLREYIFNSLIPVIHLLIYVIFVKSAQELVGENTLYAIVCMGFIIPAEKFIRKMFGFDKSTTVNPAGAATGGAMVMNAINKIGNTDVEEAEVDNKLIRTTGMGGGNLWSPQVGARINEESPQVGARINEESPQVRARINEESPQRESGTNEENLQFEPETNGENSQDRFETGEDQENDRSSQRINQEFNPDLLIEDQGNNISERTISGQNIKMDEYRPKTQNFRAGMKEAVLDRFNRNTMSNFAKNGGKRVIRGFAKGFAGATLGTVALGAGIATGDAKNAFTYTLAGIASGSKLSGKVANKGISEAIRTGSAFKKGVLGDEYKVRQTITELKNNRDFTSSCKAVGIESSFAQEELIRQFMANGIMNKEDIVKAVVARKNYEKAAGIIREKGKNGSTIITQKDEKRNITKQQTIAPDGSMVYIEKDENGNILKKETIKPNGSMTYIEKDEHGNILKQETTKPNKSGTYIIKDRNGNIIKKEIIRVQKDGSIIITTIDKDGNVTREKVKDYNKYIRNLSVGITNRRMIDLAVYEQGIGNGIWADPVKRIRLMQGLYERGIEEEEIERAELFITAMKQQDTY